MTDERRAAGRSGIEERLARAFGSGPLPSAPDTLRDALEHVPDAPVVGGRVVRRRGGAGRRAGAWGIVGIAAVLALGGALAVSLGQRGPSPDRTTPSPSTAVVVLPSTRIGTRLTYTFQWPQEGAENAADVQAIEVILRKRLGVAGVEGYQIQVAGLKAIAVQLPAGVDPEPLRRLLRTTGDAAFVPLGQEEIRPGQPLDPGRSARLFGSEGVESAAIGTDQTGERVVTFQLTPEAARTFEAWTAAHIGESFAIGIDGIVVSAPMIQAAIPGGEVQISGGNAGLADQAEARFLAGILDSGPYPVPLGEFEIVPLPTGAQPLVPPPGVDPTPVRTTEATQSPTP